MTTVEEVLETVAEFDREAHSFYVDLVPKVSKNIRYIVEDLARAELAHIIKLRELARSQERRRPPPGCDPAPRGRPSVLRRDPGAGTGRQPRRPGGAALRAGARAGGDRGILRAGRQHAARPAARGVQLPRQRGDRSTSPSSRRSTTRSCIPAASEPALPRAPATGPRPGSAGLTPPARNLTGEDGGNARRQGGYRMTKKNLLMVGAGLSGAVIGRELAEAGHRITIVDARDHIAGNCHTERDAETGVMVHVYGPHIFHTDDAEVWDYVNGFETFLPYKNRVKTTVGGAGLFAAGQPAHDQPVLRPDHAPRRGARLHRQAQADTSIADPQTFEEQALRFVGPRSLRGVLQGLHAASSGAAARPNCRPRSSNACRCGSTTTTTISSTGSRACRRTATPR